MPDDDDFVDEPVRVRPLACGSPDGWPNLLENEMPAHNEDTVQDDSSNELCGHAFSGRLYVENEADKFRIEMDAHLCERPYVP